ncbi:MAG: hypothetical protein C0594_00485 [Marinilabiliales bacterium]|nr:MAG: hypothetical protein C0594_00485 [Marinilabiliales bacterium]
MGIQERKEREREQRKQDIADAAQKVFREKGFDRATIDDVAQRAELSKGTVYLYFKSKEELQFAVFQRGSHLLIEMFQKAIDRNRPTQEVLLQMASVFIEFSRKHADYFELFMFFQSSNLSKLNIEKETIEDYFYNKSPFKLVFDIVSRGIEDGTLRNDLSVDLLASTLWSQMLGLLIVLHNKKEIFHIFNVDTEEVLKSHFEIILRGALKN